MTWKFISKISASGSNQVNFTNIPQTHKDLAIIFTARGAESGTQNDLECRPNVGSISNSIRTLGVSNFNNGLSAAPSVTGQSTYFVAGWIAGSGQSSGRMGSGMLYFPNYTSSTTGNALSYSNNMRVLTDSALLNIGTFVTSGLGNPLTSLRFQTPNSSNFQSDSVFYLYGIS